MTNVLNLRHLNRFVVAAAALLASAVAMAGTAPDAHADVRWGDRNVSEVKFFCSSYSSSITIRSNTYAFGTYQFGSATFEFWAYNYGTGRWEGPVGPNRLGESWTFSAPRGSRVVFYVHYQYRLASGAVQNWWEYGDVTQDGVRLGQGGVCRT